MFCIVSWLLCTTIVQYFAPLDGTESPAVQHWLLACIMFAMVANWMTKATTLSLLPVFTIQPAHNLLE